MARPATSESEVPAIGQLVDGIDFPARCKNRPGDHGPVMVPVNAGASRMVATSSKVPIGTIPS